MLIYQHLAFQQLKPLEEDDQVSASVEQEFIIIKVFLMANTHTHSSLVGLEPTNCWLVDHL